MADPDDLDIASLPPQVVANAVVELMREFPAVVRIVCETIASLPPEAHTRLGELIAIERREYEELKELCVGVEAIIFSPITLKN